MYSVVVISSGRSGSHLICQNLSRHFDEVIHSHNPLYKPQSDNVICVINKRYNMFEAILSMLLTKRTDEFIKYSNKQINRFDISKEEFTSSYIHNKAFYKLIDTGLYKKTIEIYYEDLINNPQHLFSLLGIDDVTKYLTQKSPYNYYELISNVDELQLLYNTLSQAPITQQEIDIVKSTIESDLLDIRLNHNGNRKI